MNSKRSKSSKNRTGQFDKSTKFKPKKTLKSKIDDEVVCLRNLYHKVDAQSLSHFKEFPLTSKTKKGLEYGKYENPTAIQKESIILAVQDNDILGAAKTGSGKTLAFLIPVLECLYKAKWTQLDGLGALIISPTRELAYQIFEVLRIVGKFHDFSAGLVIGGKHLRDEAERINKTNIVICTPGRLLQHMDETINFNADNLQILVLDEADRILDMGFQESMNAIIQNLPPTRQSLLFSATQTKSVKDLARLSLKDPMYVSVHEKAQYSTPTQLQQSFIVCQLHEKLDVLWSFIRNHVKKKILVFMSSCKQVRYVYEAFKKLHPGVTVLSLHGAMQQMKRVATYDAFCRKQSAVLFATDIAARGLDFPAVNWVIQLDCPEDANTYIHRAGRTARYEKDGESLLILLPTEEKGMLTQLAEKKIPANKIRVNMKKMSSIQPKLESLCASDIEMKQFAQRAFMSYIKAVFFMKNKDVFDVTKLDTDSYARSLGLAIPPRIRFLQKELDRRKAQEVQKQPKEDFITEDPGSNIKDIIPDILVSKNKLSVSTSLKSGSSDEDSSDNDDESAKESNSKSESSETDSSKSENEIDEDVNKDKTSESGTSSHNITNSELSSRADKRDKLSEKKAAFSFGEDVEVDDLLKAKVKSGDVIDDSDSEEDVELDKLRPQKKDSALTKAAIAKKILKKNLKVNTKVTFDEDGQEVVNVRKKAMSGGKGDEFNIEEAMMRMQEADKVDKELFREKLRQRKFEKKIKEKEKRRGIAEQYGRIKSPEDEPIVTLGTPEDSDDESDADSENSMSLQVKSKSYSENEDGFNSEDEDRYNSEDEDNDNADSDTSYDSDGKDSNDDNEVKESRKRPLKKDGKSLKGSKHNKKAKFDTGLSLLDDEQLALQLLMDS